MFPRAFRAMKMRPASLEGHCPTGKRLGLIAMSGAMARENMGWLPRLLLGPSYPRGILAGMGSETAQWSFLWLSRDFGTCNGKGSMLE